MIYRKYLLVCLIAIVAATALMVCRESATAQGNEIGPNANLEVFGIPKAPASLAPKVRRYSNNYGLPLAGWDPAKREIWLKGISSVSWVSRLASQTVYVLNLPPAGVPTENCRRVPAS